MSERRSWGCRRANGFTLLEVAVAAAIAAVLVAVVSSAMGVAVDGWRRGATSAARRVQAATVLERLTAELREAVWLGGVEHCFAGDGSSIRWVMRRDDKQQMPGLTQVEYRYDSDRHVLQRSSQMIEAGRLIGDAAWSVVWEPLSDCTFGFPYEETASGPSWAGGGLVWHSEWRQADRLPAAVRIDVSWDEGETQTWERIVVIPHGVVGDATMLDG